jgi:hypothetical protein
MMIIVMIHKNLNPFQATIAELQEQLVTMSRTAERTLDEAVSRARLCSTLNDAESQQVAPAARPADPSDTAGDNDSKVRRVVEMIIVMMLRGGDGGGGRRSHV